jgi:hypothetical protein
MLGHCGSDRMEKTAKIHDLKLNSENKTCEYCSIAKASHKNFKKDWKGGNQVPGERLYLDISSIEDLIYGGSKFWDLIVDDYTFYSWSIFLTSKSDLKNKILSLLNASKISGIHVKLLCCDESGENKSFYIDTESSLNSQV